MALRCAILSTLLALLAAAGWKWRAVASQWPPSLPDEVLLLEPAVSLAETGRFASPGVALQCDQPGVAVSYRDRPFTYFPVYPGLQGLVHRVAGADMSVRRGVDAAVWLLAAAAFFFAARGLGRREWVWAGTAVFSLHTMVWWFYPGRADLLAAACGLVAVAPVLDRQRVLTWRTGLWTGAWCGVATLTHGFAGMFWAPLAALVLVSRTGWRAALAPLGAAFAGGVAVLALWPLLAWWRLGPDWALEFSGFGWPPKAELPRNVPAALGTMTFVLGVLNPLVLLLTVMLWARGRLRSPNATLSLLIAGYTVCLVLVHAALLEYYNYYSAPHFWAALVLAMIAAVGTDPEPARRWLAWVPALIPVVALYLGGFATAPLVLQAGALPHADLHRDVRNLIRQTIPAGSRVLSDCALFFEAPRGTTSVMWWYDRLDLASFDYVISREPQSPARKALAGPVAGVLPEPLNSQFHQHFELVASIPEAQPARRRGISLYFPGNTWAVYLYRNRKLAPAP